MSEANRQHSLPLLPIPSAFTVFIGRVTVITSGALTNLKVGGPGPAQKWGHRNGAKCRKKFWSCPYTFWAIKVPLVVLVSAFVMVSTVWSVYFLLFFY